MSEEAIASESSSPPPTHPAWPHIEKAIEDLRFGEVTLIEQEARTRCQEPFKWQMTLFASCHLFSHWFLTRMALP